MIIPLRSYRFRIMIILILTAFIVLGAILRLATPKSLVGGKELEIDPLQSLPVLSENTLIGVSPPFIPYVETYGAIIDKLAGCESSNNPEAVNWNDNGSPSFGLLQFKSGTFQYYCVDKYNLPNDIMDGNIQRECCDKMISEGLLYHWSCRLVL